MSTNHSQDSPMYLWHYHYQALHYSGTTIKIWVGKRHGTVRHQFYLHYSYCQGGCVWSQVWVANFTLCVNKCSVSTLAVKMFHTTAVAHVKAIWHPAVQVLGTSRRRLDTPALVLLFQETWRAARCGVCCTALGSTVRALTLHQCCKVIRCLWGESGCRFHDGYCRWWGWHHCVWSLAGWNLMNLYNQLFFIDLVVVNFHQHFSWDV